MEDSGLKADPAGASVRDGRGATPEGLGPAYPGAGMARTGAEPPGEILAAPVHGSSTGAPEPGALPERGASRGAYRTERDLLGEMKIPAGDLRGIHTHRALGNFRVAGRPTRPALIRAYALVKKACALANAETGWLDPGVAEAIARAADEAVAAMDGEEGASPFEPGDLMPEGSRGGADTTPAGIAAADFWLDALQGGAGTSTNMNVNEVLASRATGLLSEGARAAGFPGPARVDPLAHVNLHQSTNDTYPTALRVALIAKARGAAEAAALLQGAFQAKERETARVVTVGRTELQGAVPMTLGAIFSAMAEAAGRDRWRTFKCEERLRVVNLGGTAVGTGLTAPRKYIFRATEILRALTGYPLARAENAVDATANADALAEVAGIVAAQAANLSKAARDLRQLAAFGDIELPAVQAGSSIMPGKVNPVILEATIQAGMRARSECALAAEAVGEGTLQINEFLPLVADSLLDALDLVTNASRMLARHVRDIRPNEEACAAAVDRNPIAATAFLPLFGYEGVGGLVKEWEAARAGNGGGAENFREWLSRKLGAELVDRVLSPAALSALGHGEKPKEGK